MASAQRSLILALSTAALAVAAPMPCIAALKVENTSSYVGSGRWDWKIFVDADPKTLQQIECVEYTLHQTFPDPVRKVCNEPQNKFALSASGWGTFTVKVKVQYKDGHDEAVEHRLVFKQQATLVPIDVTSKNWSRLIEPGWWEWGIYIDGTPSELDRIRCVEYTLHPTFANPVRMVCSREKGFQLLTRGWGPFTVGIKLMLKDNSILPMSHQLELH